MLAPIAAVHLLALVQAQSPEPPPAAPPAATAAPAARPAAPRPVSLLGAEPLRGASTLAAWAGWSSLGAAWGVGVGPDDDAGVLADHDWAKSELRLGGFWRHAFGAGGGFDWAGRLALSWYTNFGSTWVHSDNQSDRGIDLAPALVASQRAGGGLLAVSLEAPMTVTFKYGAGFLFSPKLALSYETSLYPQLTVGARAAAGYRAGAGDAPMREGRGELQFLLLAGYQLL